MLWYRDDEVSDFRLNHHDRSSPWAALLIHCEGLMMCTNCNSLQYCCCVKQTAQPNERKFWIVWNPESSVPPTKRYTSEGEAVAEAARLAAQFPIHKFYVMQMKTHSTSVYVPASSTVKTFTAL